MSGIISGIIDTLTNALGLEDTTLGKILSAAVETLTGAVTGDYLSVVDGARKFASAAAEEAAKVEYVPAGAKGSSEPACGYAKETTPGATAKEATTPAATIKVSTDTTTTIEVSTTASTSSTASSTASSSTPSNDWDAELSNAATVLHDYFDLFDAAAGVGGPDGAVSLKDLEALLAKNPNLPDNVRRACRFLMQNPAAFTRLDVAAGIGSPDGIIGRTDVDVAVGEKGAGISDWDRKYANAVKAVSDNFGLIDRTAQAGFCGILTGADGMITKQELQDALKNPDLPQELKEGINFLLSNPAALDALDGAGGAGKIDGAIMGSDVRWEMRRVGQNAGKTPDPIVKNPGTTTSSTTTPSGSTGTPASQGSSSSTCECTGSDSPDVEVVFNFGGKCGSSGRASGGRFDGMSPEEIVEAILLGSLNDLDDQMVDLAKQLDAAQTSQANAEKGSSDEKKATNDVNRLQFKLQQVAERRRQMFELMSNIANLSHEMARAAISNLGRA